MNRSRFQYLLEKHKQSALSAEEKEEFLQLPDTGELMQWLEEDLRQEWEQFSGQQVLAAAEKEQLLQQIVQQLPHAAAKHRPLHYIKLAVFAAAACLLAVVAGIYLFKQQHAGQVKQPVATTQPAPLPLVAGGNKAVLTLADGSKIMLDSAANGTLAKQGATALVKTAGGILAYRQIQGATPATSPLYNKMETPRGGVYQLILPDGTTVWLNSASSIRYPSVFTGTYRQVEISGEAYFQVAKNETQPFIVSTAGMQVQVLGTEFNLMAYTDEDAIKTTLVNGAVKLVKNNSSRVIKPGEQGSLENGHQDFVVSHADLKSALAWKQGYFRFDGAKITAIMRQVARWYDVEIVYEGKIPEEEFYGFIPKKENASEILEALQLTHNVHFRQEGRKIIVLAGNG